MLSRERGTERKSTKYRFELCPAFPTPPMSHPTLHALATLAGTGIGPISSSPVNDGSSQLCPGPVHEVSLDLLAGRRWAGFIESVAQVVHELPAGGQVACPRD